MLKDGRFLFRAVSSVLFLGNISHTCGDRGPQVRRNTGQLSLRLLSCSGKPNYFASTNIKTFVFISLRPLICFVFFKLEKSSLCCFEIGKALDRRHSHFSFQKQEKPFIFRAEVHTVLLVSVEHTPALAFQCADS